MRRSLLPLLCFLGFWNLVLTITRETTEAIEAEIERQRESVKEKKRQGLPPIVDERKLQQYDRVVVTFQVPEEGRVILLTFMLPFDSLIFFRLPMHVYAVNLIAIDNSIR